jgi:flagellar basal-body rod modification protein FlgD
MSITPTESVGSPYFGGGAPTGQTGSAAGTSDTSSTSGLATSSTDQMNKDMFLKLMVTQLKNQDPMNPTDSSQFLAQTAQFTSLEKLEAVAQQSAQALTAQMAFGASGLVGRSVSYTDATGAETKGTVASVRFTSTGPLLGIGDAEIELGKVTKVLS